jgi:hypothetical protein
VARAEMLGIQIAEKKQAMQSEDRDGHEKGRGSQCWLGGRWDPHDLGSRGGRRENEEGVRMRTPSGEYFLPIYRSGIRLRVGLEAVRSHFTTVIEGRPV